MSKDASSVAAVRVQLAEVGFKVVQLDARISADSRIRPDVVAWASNEGGALVPWAVVEVCNGKDARQILALQNLIHTRDVLGTVDHYAVINGKWFRADRGLRELEPVDGPTAPDHGSGGWLTDRVLATSLVLDRLAYDSRTQRAERGRVDFIFPDTEVMLETNMPGVDVPGAGWVPVRPDVLWQARREALVSWASRSSGAESSTSDPVIAGAVAALVGERLHGTVLDPFCGTGSFLWEALDRAAELESPTEFIGYDINEKVAELAGQIGRLAPLLTTVKAADAYRVDLPEADVLVTAPPFGVRMDLPRQLSNGSTTKDGVIGAVDLCVQTLRPGGRAVLHLPANFTFTMQGEQFRYYLANDVRVGAIIGLPGGAVAGSGMRSVLLVIDKAEPGETFVAQLGEDWRSQLGPKGAAVQAALAHLDQLAEES